MFREIFRAEALEENVAETGIDLEFHFLSNWEHDWINLSGVN